MLQPLLWNQHPDGEHFSPLSSSPSAHQSLFSYKPHSPSDPVSQAPCNHAEGASPTQVATVQRPSSPGLWKLCCLVTQERSSPALEPLYASLCLWQNAAGTTREEGLLATRSGISVQLGREGMDAKAWLLGWICSQWQEPTM